MDPLIEARTSLTAASPRPPCQTSSYSFNHSRDITCMLLYKDGILLQCLEGPIAELEALYARIGKDPRRRAVTMVNCGEGPRQFPHW